MLACLVSFANEYHVFHCHSVIFENSYGLVIISAMAFWKQFKAENENKEIGQIFFW